MNNIEDGGPAFPSVESGEEWSDMKGQYVMRNYSAGGMSLRDYFAAHALAGVLANPQTHDDVDIGLYAYRWADALLKAREQ